MIGSIETHITQETIPMTIITFVRVMFNSNTSHPAGCLHCLCHGCKIPRRRLRIKAISAGANRHTPSVNSASGICAYFSIPYAYYGTVTNSITSYLGPCYTHSVAAPLPRVKARRARGRLKLRCLPRKLAEGPGWVAQPCSARHRANNTREISVCTACCCCCCFRCC